MVLDLYQDRTAVAGWGWGFSVLGIGGVLGLASILSTLLQARHRFFAFALPPIVYNVGIIVGILAFVPALGPIGLACGVILGGALQVKGQGGRAVKPRRGKPGVDFQHMAGQGKEQRVTAPAERLAVVALCPAAFVLGMDMVFMAGFGGIFGEFPGPVILHQADEPQVRKKTPRSQGQGQHVPCSPACGDPHLVRRRKRAAKIPDGEAPGGPGQDSRG